MDLFKNIILVIIAPRVGWDDINQSSIRTSEILTKAFFPLLSILAVSAFFPMFYDATITLPATLKKSIVEFSAYFFTYYIASFLISGFYPELAKTNAGIERVNDYCLYNLIFLVILNILANVLPIDFTPVYFLMLYLPWIAFRGTEYLGVAKEKQAMFVSAASLFMLLIPQFIIYAFSIVIK